MLKCKVLLHILLQFHMNYNMLQEQSNSKYDGLNTFRHLNQSMYVNRFLGICCTSEETYVSPMLCVCQCANPDEYGEMLHINQLKLML